MWVAVYFLCGLIKIALALSQDQIFQNDWQTINIGLPIDSFHIEDKLYTLSSLGIFSVINSTTGELVYRFQSPSDIEPTSKIVRFNNDSAASVFNSDNAQVILWNLSSLYPTIEFQMHTDLPILDLTLNDGLLYTVDASKIVSHDIKSSTKKTHYISPEIIEYAKLFTNTDSKETFVFLDERGKSMLSPVSSKMNFVTIPDCSVSQIRFLGSQTNSFICQENYYYEFDKSKAIKEISGKGLLGKNISLSSFAEHITNHIINDDYVLVETEDGIKIFNYRSSALSPTSEFYLSMPLNKCKYKSFNVHNNKSNLLCVSSSDVISHFVDGSLNWMRDQSFSNSKDAVAISAEKVFTKNSEIALGKRSNIVRSFLQRSLYNWKKLKQALSIKGSEYNVYGLKKQLVVLSENQKIGVFNMDKNTNGIEQLNFVMKPDQKIIKLEVINNIPYAISNNSIFEIDLINRKLVPLESDENNLVLLHTSEHEFFMATIINESNKIQGFSVRDKKILKTWQFAPTDETIVSFEKRSYDNLNVAQNGIILQDRSVLYKYLAPNIGVVATYAENNRKINIRLINMITGQLYGSFSKSFKAKNLASCDLTLKFEENFIIFTIFSGYNLDTEVCVIDLFESLVPNKKRFESLTTYSAFENFILPSFASQCFVISGKHITALAVSNTKHNIAMKEIIFTSSNGQIFSVPKVVLDGRRNGVIGDFNKIGNKIMDLEHSEKSAMNIYVHHHAESISRKLVYDPIINPHPNFIISHYRNLVRNPNQKPLAVTVPTELESTTYFVSIDGDIFITLLHPSGSFDKLTSSFNFTAVLLTVFVLLFGILIILPKSKRRQLINMWSL